MHEMMDVFVVGFWILTVICIALFVYTHSSKSAGVSSSSDSSFRAFQRLYLVVFLLAMGNIFRHVRIYCEILLYVVPYGQEDDNGTPAKVNIVKSLQKRYL